MSPDHLTVLLKKYPIQGEGEHPRPLYFHELNSIGVDLKRIFDDLTPLLVKRNSKNTSKNIATLNMILANFVQSTLTRQPISFPSRNAFYSKDSGFIKLGLTKRSVDNAMAVLMAYEPRLIDFERGIKGVRTNQYKPSEWLQGILIEQIYRVREDYSGNPYEAIEFNPTKERREQAKGEGRQVEPSRYSVMVNSEKLESNDDLLSLHKINTFLQKHSYPLKTPIKLIYNDNFWTGGRLYCAFQNIPSNRIPLRINLRIDGEPCCEIDLKANQLRILAAMNGQSIPDDPYKEIARSLGYERKVIKYVVTKILGIGRNTKARNPSYDVKRRVNISAEDYQKIKRCLFVKYPWFEAYDRTGIGKHLQSLEGQILLKTMSDLVDRNIPSLPIHDAVFVKQADRDVAVNLLIKNWKLVCCYSEEVELFKDEEIQNLNVPVEIKYPT